MMGLTPRLAELKTFIGEYQSAYGYPPSMSEMRGALKLSSNSSISRLIKELEERGHARAQPFMARSVELISPPPSDEQLSARSDHDLMNLRARIDRELQQRAVAA